MSNWTYINGVITVSMIGRTQLEKEYILKTVLNHLPVVTGSEGDMECHVIKRCGYNTRSSCDEYGYRTNNLRSEYGRRSVERGSLCTQSEYYIVLDADLRDTGFEQSFRSFQWWLCRLSKRVLVSDVIVSIKDRVYGEKTIITNKNDVYTDMFEEPSWVSGGKSNKKNWCEHLMSNYSEMEAVDNGSCL